MKRLIILLIGLLCLSCVSADIVSIGTGGDEISLGYGSQIDLFFSGVDTTAPIVTKLSPVSGLSTTESQIYYIYNVTDTYDITSCSLIMNNVAVLTDTSISKTTSNIFDYTQIDGTFIWSIDCTDEFSNIGTSGNFSVYFSVETGTGTGSYDDYTQCYSILNNSCEDIAVYATVCPNDFFPNLISCNKALEEINLTLYEKFLEWTQGTFVNKTDNQTIITESKRIINKIPKDLNKVFTYFALKLTPSNATRGKWIIGISLIFLIFLEETYRLIKKTKVKEKW